MGLDMYLYKKTYVQNWDYYSQDERYEITITQGGKPTTIKRERISCIVEEVAYWRKFNALHSWFVDNCGNGEDDCKEVYVTESQKELTNFYLLRRKLRKRWLTTKMNLWKLKLMLVKIK